MIFSRNHSSQHTERETRAKHIGTTVLIAAFAFIIGAVLQGLWSGDRSGYGMTVLGMSIFGAPIVCLAGASSFVFRRTPVGDFLGGACLFFTVLFATLYVGN